MIYLASPYSHPHSFVRELRFHNACTATARLLRSGLHVFSPIVHGHPLTIHGVPTDWSFWEAFDRAFIERCDGMIVLTLNGWQHSIGVAAEIEIAQQLGKPVTFLSLDGADAGEIPPTFAYVATEEPS